MHYVLQGASPLPDISFTSSFAYFLQFKIHMWKFQSVILVKCFYLTLQKASEQKRWRINNSLNVNSSKLKWKFYNNKKIALPVSSLQLQNPEFYLAYGRQLMYIWMFEYIIFKNRARNYYIWSLPLQLSYSYLKGKYVFIMYKKPFSSCSDLMNVFYCTLGLIAFLI